MDPAWLLVLLPLAALSGWFGARRVRGGRTEVSSKPDRPYLESLNLVINDQHDKALDVLSTALQEHDEDLEIQLALGSLFRRRGEIERATQIHQRLLARSAQSAEQKSQILFELACDYFKGGLLDRAENLFKEAGSTSRFREQSLRMLIQIYESEHEWAPAVAVVRELSELSGEDLSHSAAQYCCELADRAIAEGDLDSAKECIAEALGYRPRFARAMILKGRIQAFGGKHAKAIASWIELSETHPHYAYEVAKLVQTSAEVLTEPDQYVRFLRSAVKVSGDDRLRLMYVDALLLRGSTEEAEDYLSDWLSQSASLVGLNHLLGLRAQNAQRTGSTEDYAFFRQVTSRLLQHRTGYECRFCGFQGRSLHWQCPGCKHWDTTAPRIPVFHDS